MGDADISNRDTSVLISVCLSLLIRQPWPDLVKERSRGLPSFCSDLHIKLTQERSALKSAPLRALILYRRRRFINHLLTYLLTYLLTEPAT